MKSPDLELHDDGTVVVEAPSVESALEAVRDHCGPDATIVEAERVQSKGIGGFFSKQLFRVRVSATPATQDASGTLPANTLPPNTLPRTTVAAPAPPTAGDEPVAADVGAAVDVVLRQVEAGETPGERTFGEALHAQLRNDVIDLRDSSPLLDTPPAPPADPMPNPGVDTSHPAAAWNEMTTTSPMPAEPPVMSEPVVTPERIRPPEPTQFEPPRVDPAQFEAAQFETAAPEQPPVEPNPFVETARQPLGRPLDEWVAGSGPVRWSVDQLSRLGFPYRLIEGLAHLDPEDDLAWVFRLAEAAGGLCGTMPQEAMLMVGSDLAPLSQCMDVDHFTYPDPPSYEGDAAVSLQSLVASDGFIRNVGAGRPVHLVCDATGFGAEVLDAPDPWLGHTRSGIAVVSTTVDALALALQVAVATSSVLGYIIDGSRLVRVTPFELALAVRSQLPRE